MPNWPKNESPTGRGYGQGSDSYREDDVAMMMREDERVIAGKRLKALQVIRDFTQDCGIDRLMDIRRVADEALALSRPVDFDADPAGDPNFGDYNIKPGGNHP